MVVQDLAGLFKEQEMWYSTRMVVPIQPHMVLRELCVIMWPGKKLDIKP